MVSQVESPVYRSRGIPVNDNMIVYTTPSCTILMLHQVVVLKLHLGFDEFDKLLISYSEVGNTPVDKTGEMRRLARLSGRSRLK